MHSNHPRPWQLAAVSRVGRLVVAMLAALSLDSAITWSSFASSWSAAILVVAPLLIAIRVARGFEQSLATAISMFIAGAAFALGRLPDGSSMVATLSLVGVGVVAAFLEIRRNQRQSTIQLNRTNRDGPEPVFSRR